MKKFALLFSFAVILIAATAAGCTGADNSANPSEMTATGMIKVGAMNFNEISIDEVTGLTSASKFGVEDVETYKNIGGADPLTFMGSDSITLRIMDVNGNLLGTGTLSIPGEYGEYPFTVTLVNV